MSFVFTERDTSLLVDDSAVAFTIFLKVHLQESLGGHTLFDSKRSGRHLPTYYNNTKVDQLNFF